MEHDKYCDCDEIQDTRLNNHIK